MEAFYYLDENKVKNGDFTLLEYDIEEFLNPNYKTLELIFRICYDYKAFKNRLDVNVKYKG